MLTNTEKYLILAIQSGDYKAFRMLFDSFYPGLCRLARSYLHSQETAEDLVSDFFVKIWEQPEILSPSVSLKGYLGRSIYNSCMNYLQRHHRFFASLDSLTNEKLFELMPRDADELPYSTLLYKELDIEIEKTIEILPAECRKIFVMSRREGWSHHEIAEKLQISENTVKVQIYRALAKLRERLKSSGLLSLLVF